MDSISQEESHVIVVIGRRNTGKSVLVRDFLNHNQSNTTGTVITVTEKGREFYGSLYQKPIIHQEYKHTAIIENIIKEQKEKIKRGETERTFIVLDQCFYDNSWAKEPMRQLLNEGKGLNITTVLIMQYPMGMPNELREQIDCVFFMEESVLTNRKRFYDYYGGAFPSFDTLCHLMNQYTQNYGCLVIIHSPKIKKENIEKGTLPIVFSGIFQYRVDLEGKFEECSDDVIALDLPKVAFGLENPKIKKDKKEAILNKELEILKKELEILELLD